MQGLSDFSPAWGRRDPVARRPQGRRMAARDPGDPASWAGWLLLLPVLVMQPLGLPPADSSVAPDIFLRLLCLM